MKLWISALVFLLVSSLAESREVLDRLVAVVNGQAILHSDIQAKLDAKLPVVVSSYPALKESPIYQQSLQDSINYMLIEQEADKLEIEFSDAEVEDQIKKTFQQRGVSFGSLMEELRRTGISYETYKENYKKNLIVARFTGRVIAPLIKITDKDLETFYLKKTGEQSSNLQLSLRQIMIKVPEGTPTEVAVGKKKLSNKVYRDLQGGLDFAEAVKIYSDDESGRENGGQMGSWRVNDLSPVIRKAIENLQVGEFSRPVKTPLGYHIFYMDKKEFSGSSDFEAVKGRLERELRVVESSNQVQKWLAARRKRSEVKVIK